MRRKNLLSLVLTAVIFVTLVLAEGLIVYADGIQPYTFDVSQGDITISKDTENNNIIVTYGGGQTQNNITTDQQIIIKGTTEAFNVKVDGVTANIMLSNVDIQFHIADSADKNKCAFELTGGADVTLTLQEGTTNILKSGRNKAGLGVPNGQSLKIQGTGALDAIGCINGAGIGGSQQESGGNITIAGGNIEATGGAYGAGIGGGYNGAGGSIRILNGYIIAIGGQDSTGYRTRGAGIGGGTDGNGGNISIEGGIVTAIGGGEAAGIGGGQHMDGGIISITGGDVTATGGDCAAGIGHGREAYVTTGSSITIDNPNGKVTAIGGAMGGAGIGGGLSSSGGMITIKQGIVEATGGSKSGISGGDGAGIGGGCDGAGGVIQIEGGIVTATGGRDDGAGIGGGSHGAGGDITIKSSVTLRAASNGEKAAIDIGQASASHVETGVFIAKLPSVLPANTTASVYSIDSSEIPYTISFAPAQNYRSIAFAVPLNNTYQFKIGDALQMNSGTPDFVLSGEGLNVFSSVATFPESDKGALTDRDVLTEDLIKGSNPNLNHVTSALANPLPSVGTNGSAITWQSANNTVISNDGKTIIRPAYGENDANVSLTATIKKGSVTITKVFSLTVLAETEDPDISKAAADQAALTEDLIKGSNPDLNHITSALANPLPSVGANGSAITWQSANNTVISNDGKTIIRPAYGENDANVSMTATIKKGNVTITKVFSLTVLAETDDPDISKVAADQAALTEDLIKGSNPDINHITSALANPLPSVGINGSVITWSSNTPSVISNDGQAIIRPVYGKSNTLVTLTATIKKGGITKTKDFNLTVLASPSPSNGGGGSSSSGNSLVTAPVDSQKNANVTLNGTAIKAGAVTLITENGKKVSVITLDGENLALQDSSELIISFDTDTDVQRIGLNIQLIKAMKDKKVIIKMKTPAASYILKTEQVDIDAALKELGESSTLKDIMVDIEIAKVSEEMTKTAQEAANKGKFTLLTPLIEFNIKCTYKQKTAEIKKFKSYVERTLTIPEGTDRCKITTGVVIEQDGSVRQIPSKIDLVDGRYYVVMNSFTNSSYTVISHPKTFKDTENHWAKEAINDIGSRMIINGIDEEQFAPDREITRGEFTAIIVRALGLKPDEYKGSFGDVKSSDWYASSIETAITYNLISGYGKGKFGPTDKITREQAMSIIARAMKLTGLNAEVKPEEIQTLLANFGDAAKASNYAKASIAACIKTGIANPTEGKMKQVKGNITRAEVAVLIRRMLQKSNLI